MNQTEKRMFLIRSLLDEQPQYRNMGIPSDQIGQRRLLRSLFNLRMPGVIGEDFLKLQDEYLQERNRKNGIVTLNEIPTIASQGSRHPYADRISIWQGDITRLAADAVVNAANSQMLGCFVPMIFLRRK